jgi:hypothetical protein
VKGISKKSHCDKTVTVAFVFMNEGALLMTSQGSFNPRLPRQYISPDPQVDCGRGWGVADDGDGFVLGAFSVRGVEGGFDDTRFARF